METHSNFDEPQLNERQTQIVALIAQDGKVRTARLIGLFGVSEPTLRKDLSVLEQRGLLKRTHGGAVATRPPVEKELESRAALNRAAKQAIARACLREIGDGAAVFLDSGTTVLEIARLLRHANLRLSVLTNAPDVADTIADTPTISHVLLGGQLRRISRAISGAVALDYLSRFTLTTAFIGAGGVTEQGITVADASEAQLKAAVIARAQQVIVAVDSTKFGAADFVRVCSLDEIDTIVTESADSHITQMCETHGVRLVIASEIRAIQASSSP